MPDRDDEDFNYWPGVADVFLGFCLLALFLWFAHHLSVVAKMRRTQAPPDNIAVFQDEIATLKATLAVFQDEIATLKATLDLAEKEKQRLREENARKAAELARLNKMISEKPPVIRLAERENFRFPSGSAALSPEFQRRLETDIFPKQILPALQQFGAVVDTIEIVGHTDGQAVSLSDSNLDRWGVDVLNRRLPLQRLRAGSNLDLGWMRALAVREVLRPWLDKEGHARLKIRSYSAGAGVRSDGEAPDATDALQDESRRRIEIRFLGLGTAADR